MRRLTILAALLATGALAWYTGDSLTNAGYGVVAGIVATAVQAIP